MHAELPAFKGTGDGMQYGFLILTEGGVGWVLPLGGCSYAVGLPHCPHRLCRKFSQVRQDLEVGWLSLKGHQAPTFWEGVSGWETNFGMCLWGGGLERCVGNESVKRQNEFFTCFDE